MPQEHYQSQLGIILKKIPYSESDEIIHVLLQYGGMQKFFVRGARKSEKRYGGLIDYFAHLKFFYKAEAQGLPCIHGAESVEGTPPAVWKDLKAFAFGSFVSELLCEFSPEAVIDHDYYHFWLEMEHELRNEAFNPLMATRYLLKLFQQAGYAVPVDQLEDREKNILRYLVEFAENIMQRPCRSAQFFLKMMDK